jgi:hypothetical protein
MTEAERSLVLAVFGPPPDEQAERWPQYAEDGPVGETVFGGGVAGLEVELGGGGRRPRRHRRGR